MIKFYKAFISATLTAAAFVWAVSGGAMAAELNGSFNGIDTAAGARIEISPDANGYSGTFFDSRGKSQAFKADRNGDIAQAVLDMGGETVLMQMLPMPYGARVLITPIDASGKLQPGGRQELSFLRPELKVPALPSDFVAAPSRPGIRLTANSFLASYEFWEPAGVRNGYLSLAPRSQTLIRLFAPVQLDVIWKLCLAPDADQALGVALRGQGVACDEVIKTIAAMQRDGRFSAYKANVAESRDQLRQVVRCAESYVESKEACDRAAKNMSATAVSLETAASVLNTYR